MSCKKDTELSDCASSTNVALSNRQSPADVMSLDNIRDELHQMRSMANKLTDNIGKMHVALTERVQKHGDQLDIEHGQTSPTALESGCTIQFASSAKKALCTNKVLSPEVSCGDNERTKSLLMAGTIPLCDKEHTLRDNDLVQLRAATREAVLVR
jgi:hypothetical protein